MKIINIKKDARLNELALSDCAVVVLVHLVECCNNYQIWNFSDIQECQCNRVNYINLYIYIINTIEQIKMVHTCLHEDLLTRLVRVCLVDQQKQILDYLLKLLEQRCHILRKCVQFSN